MGELWGPSRCMGLRRGKSEGLFGGMRVEWFDSRTTSHTGGEFR